MNDWVMTDGASRCDWVKWKVEGNVSELEIVLLGGRGWQQHREEVMYSLTWDRFA